LLLPAEVLTPGANFAHKHRCPAGGKRAVSTPIAAMTTAAAAGPIPGISSSRRLRGERGQQCLDLDVQRGDIPSIPSID